MQVVPALTRSQRRLIVAASHEAGHAVAAYYVRIRFRQIAIGETSAKELGWLELWLPPQRTANGVADVRTGHRIERSIIVLLTGSQAERVILGHAKYLRRPRFLWERTTQRRGVSKASHHRVYVRSHVPTKRR